MSVKLWPVWGVGPIVPTTPASVPARELLPVTPPVTRFCLVAPAPSRGLYHRIFPGTGDLRLCRTPRTKHYFGVGVNPIGQFGHNPLVSGLLTMCPVCPRCVADRC